MDKNNPIREEKVGGKGLPAALVQRSRVSWWLWFIPAGALLLCFWFVYRDVISAGPVITIYFKSAEGLETQDTPITYRGARVGQITATSLTPDNQLIKVQARLIGTARNLARSGSVFWIVRPELSIGAISGLRTIVSGEYIAVQPGNGAPTNSFQGAEFAPFDDQQKTVDIVLTTSSVSSIRVKSPVFFRGVEVGEVADYELAHDSTKVFVHLHIWSQFAPLVRVDSKFWNAGGLDVHFGIFKGLQLSGDTPRAILGGAVAFATPPNYGEPATNGWVFTLYDKPDDKWNEWVADIALKSSSGRAFTNSYK